MNGIKATPDTHTHTAVASTRRACVLAWQAIRNHHRVDLWWEAQSDTLDHTHSHIHILTHTLPRVCQCCRLIWLTGAWGFTWPFFLEFSPGSGCSTFFPRRNFSSAWILNTIADCLHFTFSQYSLTSPLLVCPFALAAAAGMNVALIKGKKVFVTPRPTGVALRLSCLL